MRAEEGGESVSGAFPGCFLGGSARDRFRKLRKEVLPELRAPMMRMLYGVGSFRRRTLRGELIVETTEVAYEYRPPVRAGC